MIQIKKYLNRDKPWGYEEILANGDHGYVGKILHIEAGEELSVQYHTEKHETLILIQGKVEINNILMLAHYSYIIPPNTIHHIKNVGHKLAKIFEISTMEIGETIRLEDKYGRVDQNLNLNHSYNNMMETTYGPTNKGSQ